MERKGLFMLESKGNRESQKGESITKLIIDKVINVYFTQLSNLKIF